MSLFSKSQMEQINAVAEKSKNIHKAASVVKSKSINNDLNEMSAAVVEYFKDSPAILITDEQELHDYVTKLIESGYAGIDTETTGLDRYYDWIVGASLYYPGGVECYIPIKHLVPIFDEPYKNQLTYEQVHKEFQRIVDAKTKLIFANADFDLAMIYKDLKIDFNDNCYYDVLIAWRCLKENELHNNLKALYNKYVLKGKGDPKRFSDFFSPQLFPYCKPEIAKLYAANDAKITYELFKWQLPYCTKDHPKCKKAHLEAIADLIWNVEFPMIKVCQNMFRTGIYIDQDIANVIRNRYNKEYDKEIEILQNQVQDLIDNTVVTSKTKRPFNSGKDFNPNSTPHAKYLIYDLLKIPQTGSKAKTDKEAITDINLPVTNQILKVRSLKTLISTFTDKLPKAVTPDGRIHAQFKQIGADTGRMSSASPNLQNIPSHAVDIRHMFRATPGYVMISSDFSQQEPKLTAYVGNIKEMIEGFKKDQDAYAMIASVAYNVPYEKCLEFHPITHEYQPDGKARRNEAKSILLGVLYGRSVVTIADQLFGKDTSLSDEEKVKKAQKVYDAVMNAFPGLRQLMISTQNYARKHGYTETVLGRRRHLPDMQLPEFEFKPMRGYVNPDIDPLDVASLQNKEQIPARIVAELEKEFSQYKYFGQIAKRTKELYEEKIRVINNRPKITDATRQCLNGVIQGSAADLTKMAMLRLESNPEWKAVGGRLLIPVHDELIAEVPVENAEKGGEILSRCMVEAANFLPFTINCDVETTWRWYGLDYDCKYKKPESIKTSDEDEIKWIQYHLTEMEYQLPVFKDKNGEKPKGDAAKGINGKETEEYFAAISDYMKKYRVSESNLISHIDTIVTTGKAD